MLHINYYYIQYKRVCARIVSRAKTRTTVFYRYTAKTIRVRLVE